MLKQCRVRECRFGKYCVYLYHDGKLISEEEHWDGEEFDQYLDKLAEEGYVECYSSEEIEQDKRQYEYRSKHTIGGAPHWISLGLDDNSNLEMCKCSVCGRKQFGRSKYCASCGVRLAKLEG